MATKPADNLASLDTDSLPSNYELPAEALAILAEILRRLHAERAGEKKDAAA